MIEAGRCGDRAVRPDRADRVEQAGGGAAVIPVEDLGHRQQCCVVRPRDLGELGLRALEQGDRPRRHTLHVEEKVLGAVDGAEVRQRDRNMCDGTEVVQAALHRVAGEFQHGEPLAQRPGMPGDGFRRAAGNKVPALHPQHGDPGTACRTSGEEGIRLDDVHRGCAGGGQRVGEFHAPAEFPGEQHHELARAQVRREPGGDLRIGRGDRGDQYDGASGKPGGIAGDRAQGEPAGQRPGRDDLPVHGDLGHRRRIPGVQVHRQSPRSEIRGHRAPLATRADDADPVQHAHPPLPSIRYALDRSGQQAGKFPPSRIPRKSMTHV